MSFKVIKDGHGRAVGVEFRPNLRMLRVVVEMNKAENNMMATEEILEKCNVKESEWIRWQNEYVVHEYGPDKEILASKNHFADWLDSALQIKSGEERQMLREVGMQKALAGEYNYWKDMSRTYGAVSAEPIETQKKAIPFNLPTNATPEQLIELRKKLLEQQRSVGDGAGPGLSRLAAKRPKGANT